MSLSLFRKSPTADVPPTGAAHARHAQLHAERRTQAAEFDALSDRIAAIQNEVVARDSDVRNLALLEKSLHDNLVAIEMGQQPVQLIDELRTQIFTTRARKDAPRNKVLTGIRAKLEEQRMALRDRQIATDKALLANLPDLLREMVAAEGSAIMADIARTVQSRRRAYVIAWAFDAIADQLKTGIFSDARSYRDLSIPLPKLPPFITQHVDHFAEARANADALVRRDVDAMALTKEAEALLHSLLMDTPA